MAHEPATRIAGHNLQFLKYNLPRHSNRGAFSARTFLSSPLLRRLYLLFRLRRCGETFDSFSDVTTQYRPAARLNVMVPPPLPGNDETNEKQRIYFWTLAPELMVQPRHIKTDPTD